jgi:hypothetical protein
LGTLTFDKLQTLWRKTTRAPLPLSLDEFSIGSDRHRPLRDDERAWPQRVLMFDGFPTEYAQWLTLRLLAEARSGRRFAWDIADVVSGLLAYHTTTAIRIVREMAVADPTVLDYVIERLRWNNQWRLYARLLEAGGAFSRRDVARLETEANSVDAAIQEKRKCDEKRIETLPDAMAAALVESFFVSPSPLLFEALVMMQRGGVAVATFMTHFVRANPYCSHTPPAALKVLMANDAFSPADRSRVQVACAEQ